MCPQCHEDMNSTSGRDKEIINTIDTCSNCSHTETETLDLSATKQSMVDKDYDTDCRRFCLNEEKGQDFIQGLIHGAMAEIVKDIQEREKNKEHSSTRVAQFKKD